MFCKQRKELRKRSSRKRCTAASCQWMLLDSYPFLHVEVPTGKQAEELTEKGPAGEEAIVGLAHVMQALFNSRCTDFPARRRSRLR